MKKQYYFAVVLVVVMALFTGCKAFPPLEAYNNYKQDQEKIFVAFSNEGEDNDPIDYQEIADYQSIYSDYNTRMMYNTLSPAEQQIYRFFEYALDKEYTTMFFDSRLLADVERPLQEILKFYSMDSPLLQQNYYYTHSESNYTFSYLGGLFTFAISGEECSVENFSHEAMEKKKETITEAEKVVATMPQDLSQLEQARFFYRYLTREVVYAENTADPGKQHNLYDAFVEKKTQCDGYANAFSLLCAMAKIPCTEKIVTPEEEGEVGHTWNVFCVDGVWYNADLSLDEDYAQLHQELDVDFTFGFSDRKAKEIPDFSEYFPACTTDLIPVELMVESASDSKLLPGIKEAFKTGGKHFVYIGLETGELTSDVLQKIANYLRSDIRTVDETIGDKNYYYIFKQ